MYTEEKPSLDELMHYGVKGMKVGVHKTIEEQRHERIMKEQGRTGDIKQRTPVKTATAPPRAVKQLQKIKNLKKMPISSLANSQKAKADTKTMRDAASAAGLAKLKAGKPLSDNDILTMWPKDQKKVSPARMAALDATMKARLKKNPKDKEADEYLNT